MTVSMRRGAMFFDGWTWHASVAGDGLLPCREFRWEGNGSPIETGRFAMLSGETCADTQRESGRPGRLLDDDDPRIVTRATYSDYRTLLIERRGATTESGTGLSGRL